MFYYEVERRGGQFVPPSVRLPQPIENLRKHTEIIPDDAICVLSINGGNDRTCETVRHFFFTVRCNV